MSSVEGASVEGMSVEGVSIIDEFAGDVPRTDSPTEEEPGLFFADLAAFVRDLVAVTYRRDLESSRDMTWCPQWWLHTEAIARLEAMWRSWEFLRRDPATGTSVWFLMHADPHMAVLLDSQRGPFHACSPKKGHRGPDATLPIVDPPADMF